MSLAAWFYTDNDAFFGGRRRQQESIAAAQVHVGYSFRPGWSITGSSTYYRGGRSTVDGIENDDVQGNSRVGAAVPASVHQARVVGRRLDALRWRLRYLECVLAIRVGAQVEPCDFCYFAGSTLSATASV